MEEADSTAGLAPTNLSNILFPKQTSAPKNSTSLTTKTSSDLPLMTSFGTRVMDGAFDQYSLESESSRSRDDGTIEAHNLENSVVAEIAESQFNLKL
jgi:hypothetical protein